MYRTFARAYVTLVILVTASAGVIDPLEPRLRRVGHRQPKTDDYQSSNFPMIRIAALLFLKCTYYGRDGGVHQSR